MKKSKLKAEIKILKLRQENMIYELAQIKSAVVRIEESIQKNNYGDTTARRGKTEADDLPYPAVIMDALENARVAFKNTYEAVRTLKEATKNVKGTENGELF
ncbi:hypothetical protein [Campylobacter sp. RM16190]|uniref:hypothetical protein n=1 Tax=Campylobacter sp. RM16190 TaxID=1705727 RepID=UPI001472F173|nr:hypothetical protein [Campylobacter sp. RM16190]